MRPLGERGIDASSKSWCWHAKSSTLLKRREMVWSGHLSARLDEQRILIKPRPVGWWRLKPENLIIIERFNGKRVDGPARDRSAVREWPIHAQIYRARQDVGCVLHAHPVASTLMASLNIEVEPLDQDCATFGWQASLCWITECLLAYPPPN